MFVLHSALLHPWIAKSSILSSLISSISLEYNTTLRNMFNCRKRKKKRKSSISVINKKRFTLKTSILSTKLTIIIVSKCYVLKIGLFYLSLRKS